MTKRKIEAETSNGNIFEDLGFDKAEASEKLLKSKLVHKISSVIKARGLKQAEAAVILGINQPKVSALLKGNLSGFSLERLIRFVDALDVEVELSFRDKDSA